MMQGLRTLLAGWSWVVNALLMGVVRAYRFFLSPWLGSACRFEPTCSAYALQALQQMLAPGRQVLDHRRQAARVRSSSAQVGSQGCRKSRETSRRSRHSGKSEGRGGRISIPSP